MDRLTHSKTRHVSEALFRKGALFGLIAVFAPKIALGAEASTSGSFWGSFLLFWIILWTFMAGLALVRLVLRIEWAPFCVARAVLAEAIRMRAAAAFILLLFLGLSALPFMLDPGAPLNYRVQALLSYATWGTVAMLSLMTIFLSCGTLAFEQEDRRIQIVLVKPISHGRYLLGKWLGIMLFNSVLLAVAGLSLYGSARLLVAQYAENESERDRVYSEILSARLSLRPRPPQSFEGRIKPKLEAMKRQDPDTLNELGLTGARNQLIEQEKRRWRNIPPGGRETYIFDGFGSKAEDAAFLQLRCKIRPSRKVPSGKLTTEVQINGRPLQLNVKVGSFQTLPISTKLLDENGALHLTVINVDPKKPNDPNRVSISFVGDDELELFYEAGTFGGNCLRGMLILWFRLGFLAMAGLLAASFLSFPVACLCSLAIFFAASGSTFLLDALTDYGDKTDADQLSYLTLVMRWLAEGLVRLLQQYGRLSIGPLLAEGRMITWPQVFNCIGWIGMVWTGLSGLLAWIIFQRRELARIQA